MRVKIYLKTDEITEILTNHLKEKLKEKHNSIININKIDHEFKHTSDGDPRDTISLIVYNGAIVDCELQ